jgi:hypothetical protein
MSLFLSPTEWYWVIVPLVAGALGLVLLLRGFVHVAHARSGRATAHLAVGTPLAVAGFALSLLALNTQTFARLSHENDVANVAVKVVDPARSLYHLTIQRLDVPDTVQGCDIQGDEWVMSARVQKWKPWANVLGLDTTYTLDQVDNKYFTAERGNGKPITGCDLKGPPPAVNRYVPQSWVFWLADQSYTEQRHFGSAAYMPLADGAVYKVVMTQSGLNAEPINAAAASANAARP